MGICHFSTHSASIVRAPETPASSDCQLSSAVPPRGEVTPMPVTTIRLVMSGSFCESDELRRRESAHRAMTGAAVKLCPGHPHSCSRRLRTPRSVTAPRDPRRSGLRVGDEGDCVAYRLEVLDLFVGNLDVELLFGVDDNRHHRNGVDVEVIGERLVCLDGVGSDPGLVIDELGQAGKYFFGGQCHCYSP